MDFIEVLIGTIALGVAFWALNLQRREIIKNGKISALIHSSNLVQEKINYHSKIIDELKINNGDWQGHAVKINKTLRPLKKDLDKEFLNVVSTYDGLLHEDKIREALKTEKN